MTHFPRNMYVYIKNNFFISNQAVQKGDIYLPDICYYNIGHHAAGFVIKLPKSNHLQKLLTPEDNLLSETNPEKINLFSKNIFKLPQETLVKTAIDNYIKKLTVSFVNESCLLYDKSNVIEQIFITEINKLICIYGSISYFNKKSVNEIVQIISFNSPLKFLASKTLEKIP